jgi:hypothetical protein
MGSSRNGLMLQKKNMERKKEIWDNFKREMIGLETD